MYPQGGSLVSDEAISFENPTMLVNDGPRRMATEASRCEIANLLLHNREVLRGRVSRKLRQAGVDGIDTEDVLSSVLRRIDMALLRGVLRTEDNREFWAYVVAVTNNVTLNKLRTARVRLIGVPTRGDEPRRLASRFAGCSDNDEAAELLHDMIMSLRSDTDRELVFWKLSGTSYIAISAATGRSPEALRSQWAKICRQLRASFPDVR